MRFRSIALTCTLVACAPMVGRVVPGAPPDEARPPAGSARADERAAEEIAAATSKSNPNPEDNVVRVQPNRWPLFRGGSESRGVAASGLPEKPQLIWDFKVPNGSFEGTPAIVDGVVYLGDLDGKVYAWQLEDGKKLWEYTTDSGFIASPAVRDGRLYVGDIDGRFHCLDAKTGKPLWGYEAQAEIDGCANFFGGHVLFGSQDATLYCLEADTGKLVWKHAIDDQIRCSPTIVEGHCFVAGCDSRLHVIDVRNGTEKAAVDIESPTGVTPAAEGARVYFGTEGGVFYCVDWKAAAIVWRFESPDQSLSIRSSPALVNNTVLFGGRDRRLHALDTASGQERWSFVTKSRVDSSPVVVGDRVYFGSSDGRLTAVRLATGEKVWEFEGSGGFTGSPAVASERLVIASDTGNVYCLGAATSR